MTSSDVSDIPLEEGGSKRKDKHSKSVVHSSLETHVDCLEYSLADGETRLEDFENDQRELSENVEALEGGIKHAQLAEVEETNVRERVT